MAGQVLRGRDQAVEVLEQGRFDDTCMPEDLDNSCSSRSVLKCIQPTSSDRLVTMATRVSILFVVPVLLLTSFTQVSLAQKPQLPKLGTRILEYSEPSVVRVVTSCFGVYSYFKGEQSKEDDRRIVKSDYPKDESSTIESRGFDFGTGYFINPNGYLLTSASFGKFAEQFPDKQICRKRLIGRILNQHGDIQEEIDKLREQSEKDKVRDLLFGSEKYTFPSGKTLQLKDDDVVYYKHILSGKGEKIPFEFVKSSKQSSKDIALIKINVNGAPALKLGNSDQVKILDEMWVIAYPPSTDLFDSEKIPKSFDGAIKFLKDLLDGFERPQVTFMQKSISTTPKSLGNYAIMLQLAEQVPVSMYGSPVLNAQGEVIGTIISVGPSRTYAVPSRTIQELLTDAGIQNIQGDTYEQYRNGLDAFWQGDYRKAAAQFRNVLSLFKQHSKAETKLAEVQVTKAGPSALGAPDFLPWITLTVLGLGIPALAYLKLRRQPQVSVLSSSTLTDTDQRPKRPTSLPTKDNPNPFIELSYQGQELQFYLGEDTYQLGRDQDWSDFDIPNIWNLISLHHAILRKEGSDYRFYDGDGQTPSSNGNMVNGVRVTPGDGYLLRHGTQVMIGPERNPILLTYFNPSQRQALDPIPSGVKIPSRKPDPTSVNLNSFIELSYQGQELQFYLGEDFYQLGHDQAWSDFEIPNSWNLISSRHAILRKEGSDYRLYDGDGQTPSSNGNIVNGIKVTTKEGYLLRHGNQVRIGPERNPVLLTYFNPAQRQAPDPTRVAES